MNKDLVLRIKLIEVLTKNNWNIEERSYKGDENIPGFDHLPIELQEILMNYKTISNPSDVAWFFTIAEIRGETESEFDWEELRQQSLDAAMNDVEINRINNFWDHHFCFLMSVKNGYSYLAICLEGKNKNKVVYGYEPEYEEVDVIFDSFDDFSNTLIKYISNQSRFRVFDQIF
ncbi:hypothetical protein ABFP33_10850 [Acinetobacter bereziniae]|uniref:hypothetical protein n=1 Tax=Acinetobacter bereziniae TaxID=106648 RepID=UPI003215294E